MGPSCTAAAGTDMASCSTPSVISTFTNWPGHRSSLELSMRALAVTVPVLGSTLFSMKAITPDCFFWSLTMAVTLTGPAVMAARRSGRMTCGMAKVT